MSDKPTRPTKSPAPDRADFAPALEAYPDLREPEKGAKSEAEHAAEVEAARAAHEADTAEVAVRNQTALEEAEAAYQEAVTAHEAAWQADLETWQADLRAYREGLPGHPLAGAWLAAQREQDPGAYPGVVAEDDEDGLGTRLEGWPEKDPAPDFETFAREHQAEAERVAEETARHTATLRALAAAPPTKAGDLSAEQLAAMFWRLSR